MKLTVANWVAAAACVAVMVMSAHQHGKNEGYLLGLSAALGVQIESAAKEGK